MNRIGQALNVILHPFIWLFTNWSHRAYAVVEAEGSILLVKNWLGSHKKWHLPGGGIKRGESLKCCLIRELKEETGIIAKPASLEQLDFKQNNFSCLYLKLNQKPKLVIRKTEIYEAKFIKKSDLPKARFDNFSQKVLGGAGGLNLL